MHTDVDTLAHRGWECRASAPQRSAALADVMRHFTRNFPILLDGAQLRNADRHHYIRQARESMTRDPRAGLPPAEILRETLDAVRAAPTPTTAAGFVAIAPQSGRVWWDSALLPGTDDILAGLDQPRPILRFYDITGIEPDAGRWHETFDVDIGLGDNGRTVQFWRSDRTYVVELGLFHADSRFVALARTNSADLPRDSRGPDADGKTARVNLRPRAMRDGKEIVPDAAAHAWVENRPDHPDRDIEAELMLHMLYRAFLREGPRALRHLPPLHRRDDDVLAREYDARRRSRERRAASGRFKKKSSSAFLVVVLEPVRRTAENTVSLYPVPLTAAASLPVMSAERFALYETLVWLSRADFRPAAGAPDLVRRTVDAPEYEISRLATPVFEAARTLRHKLTEIAPVTAIPETVPDAPEALPAAKQPSRLRDFGGSESRRIAKAGVRVTRMALTLEGRMRPGARLKVAGKLVYADADGNFRLECVLTGRRASIPLRAGLSAGGEAASVITVDWEKRAGKDRKALVTK